MPAAAKARLLRQLLMQRKEVLFRCYTIWENGGLLLQSPSPHLGQDKIQSSEPVFRVPAPI